MKLLKRILIGYVILFVMVAGAIAYALSFGSIRVLEYVGDTLLELERYRP